MSRRSGGPRPQQQPRQQQQAQQQQPAAPSGAAALVIDGELTIHTAGDRKVELLALLERGDALTVDLAGVTELDTAGLQLLLLTRREATQLGKTLEITAASNAVTEALAIVHLDARLERTTPTPQGAHR